jgi:predicted transposase YbfD/YdcC
MLTDEMESLPVFLKGIPDPRRAQGRRHPLPTVLAIATGAVLCGMKGFKAISDWAESLGQKARKSFGCRRKNGQYVVPSEYVLRDCLTRVDPKSLDNAMQEWSIVHGKQDESIAIDGKAMKNAIDEQGHQTHIMSAIGHETKECYTQIKVGTLPPKGDDEAKRTNEIGMFMPLVEAIPDISGKTITADALLTQRKIAEYIVGRGGDYCFTVKDNQPKLREDIKLFFQDRQEPDYSLTDPPDHGRIETRKIWTTTELNSYLEFPHVGQAFVIVRESIYKKTGKPSLDVAYGITSKSPEQAGAEKILYINRRHWSIENSCHYILDWNYDEDRSRIRTGCGPENITRLRRFAIGLIKSKIIAKGPKCRASVAQIMRQLSFKVRQVLDYLCMTKNTCSAAA